MGIRVQRIDKTLELPQFARKGDAAFDLRSAVDLVIQPSQKEIIPTGLKVEVPEGYAGLVWDRSGLASKKNIHALAGVIDSSYRGEVCIVLKNLGNEDFKVERNDRIAQLLVQPVAKVYFI